MPAQSYLPVLNLVQEACRQLSVNVPVGVYGTQDENALMMGSYINNIGEMLSGQDTWQQFNGFFTITGDGLQAAFDIPIDYRRLVDNTGWSYAMSQPVYLADAVQWNAAQASMVRVSLRPIFRLMGDQFVFLTPPMNGEKIQFEYVKKNWVLKSDGLTRTEFCTENGDIPLFDWLLMVISLKMKWREAKGFDTSADVNDFRDRYNQILHVNQPGERITIGGGAGGPLIGVDNLPTTGYGSR